MHTLVLLRHGQSTWNMQNRFTGWTDVGLTRQGEQEARQGAQALAQAGIELDVAFASYLKRAIKTLWLVLEGMDRMWIPVHKSWRLNERHYGALQGLDKAKTAAEYGDEQVFHWRRGFDDKPPALDADDDRHPRHDPRYAGVDPGLLPATESLHMTIDRVMPAWEGQIVPALQAGRTVLVCAHGNSLRGMVKYLDRISDADIAGVELPTGIPLVYSLDQDLNPLHSQYLSPD